jgi:EAL domain-containing protein (putative c-di-GMP-specific phosphodiesterase class I)
MHAPQQLYRGGGHQSIPAGSKSFHLRVIAQGIETREQFLVLRRLQCLEGQGPYFHERATATEFAMLLEGGCTTIAT